DGLLIYLGIGRDRHVFASFTVGWPSASRRPQHRLPCLFPRRGLRQIGLLVLPPIGPCIGAGGGGVLGGGDRRRRRTGRTRRGGRRRPGRQLWDVLAAPGGVGVAFPVVAVVERHILLVAFTHLHRGRALAGPGFARDVLGAAHVEGRILRRSAVQVAGRTLRPVLLGRHAALLGRQESGRARRRQIEVEVAA